VGSGPTEGYLKNLTSDLGLEGSVIFTGALSREDVLTFMAACDVFAMVSRQVGTNVEGFGIVFLEAGALGRPVVGGRSGGIPDAVEDGVSGLLVDPSSPDDTENALKRVLLDPDLAAQLGKAGYRRVKEQFTWDRIAARVLRTYGRDLCP
jgi:phosphatidylinositol alpha-1,6-mannosyltransferase